MIHKDYIDLLNKYSFIDKVERVGLYYYFRYNIHGNEKVKRLPLRAGKTQVMKTVLDIKTEKGVSIYGTGYNAEHYIV